MYSEGYVLEVVPRAALTSRIRLPMPRRPIVPLEPAVTPEDAPHALHTGEAVVDESRDVLNPFSHERKTQTLILARHRGNAF